MRVEKTILLGVTGSIAAYKAAALASALKKQGADVHVLMTGNACQFLSPVTFEALTGNRCLTDTFDRNFSFAVGHVSLASRADLLLVAPASADVIGKLAHGIADDMLTTTALACQCPRLLAPAMNTAMYENPIVQDNLQRLQNFGWKVLAPASGHLACGAQGIGRMPEPEELLAHIAQEIAHPKLLAGKNVLVTAGPTQEALDPVRYLTNHSTGKMGYALANVAAAMGASVTLVSGKTALDAPMFAKTVSVTTARQMYDAVMAYAADADIVLMAAAVADYRPAHEMPEKIKKGEMPGKGQSQGDAPDGSLFLPLARTRDILKELGERKPDGQFLCGFSMETEQVLERSREKLVKKKLDLIVCNDLREKGAGFGTDTNVVTLITKDAERALPLQSKEAVAVEILREIAARMT